ncbi:MAG: hypothetical protein ACKOXM_05060 [Agromyces sp.]
MRRNRSRGRVAVVLTALAAMLLSGCAAASAVQPGPQLPLDGILDATEYLALSAEFEPGNIVSDEQFYDAFALDTADVQSVFLSVPCAPNDDSPCLSRFHLRVPETPAETDTPGHCARIPAAASASAAAVIVEVARACGINPKLLVVMLQKEQSLLTRPSERGYQRATGYACPDTADCDAKYFGFFNQVYRAAWQFRQYTVKPNRKYHIGEVEVAFHPQAECGSRPVTIANQATANLYNYTPYQPDSAALTDPSGEGDRCSAWGNLNVWLLWNAWFGNPRRERIPGFLPDCVTHQNGVRCEPFTLDAPFRKESLDSR